METILRIDASARQNRSLSRNLSTLFQHEWQARRPDAHFITRDLGTSPPPFVSEEWIAAAFTSPAERTPAQHETLRPSDNMIDELGQAQLIVIATPMYNYGMPAALKAWFDQVIRINRTFSFDLERGDWPLAPILGGKTLVVLTARGEFGYAAGELRAHMNHLETHIRTCAHYLGVEEDHVIAVDYQEFGGERHQRSIDEARAAVHELVAKLSARQCPGPCPDEQVSTVGMEPTATYHSEEDATYRGLPSEEPDENGVGVVAQTSSPESA